MMKLVKLSENEWREMTVEDVLVKYEPKMISEVNKNLKRSRMDYEDFYQEMCIKVIGAFNKYNNTEVGFSHWVSKQITYAVNNIIRDVNKLYLPEDKRESSYIHNSLQAPVPTKAQCLGDSTVCLEDTIPSPRFEDVSDTKVLLDQLLSHLNDKERKVVVDHFVYEKTHKQLGEELGLSSKYISNLCGESIRKMRRKYEERNIKSKQY